MLVDILVETGESYENRKKDKDLEPDLYEIAFAFRDILLDSFMVDEIEDELTFVVRGTTYKTVNTKEVRDKFSYIINSTNYEA